ncbi:hypothetical protein HanRHA438_Chr02g0067521 [Helianthus annuus]|nr:hypothetical protein HanRHA438_Chr02g0067521 [Helianthus annuus]
MPRHKILLLLIIPTSILTPHNTIFTFLIPNTHLSFRNTFQSNRRRATNPWATRPNPLFQILSRKRGPLIKQRSILLLNSPHSNQNMPTNFNNPNQLINSFPPPILSTQMMQNRYRNSGIPVPASIR